MRVFSIPLIVMASLAQAHAQEPGGPKPKADDTCRYTVSDGQSVEVPVGTSVCFRAPAPYTDTYGVLHCYPPLQEVDQVQRGDPVCAGKYEDRERQK